MINAFESTAKANPNGAFFMFVENDGTEHLFTYRRTRLLAAQIARRLRGKGVRRGDCVSVDLPNCPEFVLLVLAAGYGGFTLVALNNRLTASEKLSRVLDLEAQGLRVSCRVDEARARTLVSHAVAALSGDGAQPRGHRPIMGAKRDAEDEATHFAEHESHLFDDEACALIMFTSGTTGKPKAVPLTWHRLMAAAAASNKALSARGQGMWQAVLPLYHIGGFEVVARSVANQTPFRLYAHFDAARVLADAALVGATHVSVVDKMLQDMLAVDPEGDILSRYRCILLGGAALNGNTVGRAYRAGGRVYASYGMTETCSQIANALVDGAFDGGLALLPGYQARIVDADPSGYGRLAVQGPGVLSNYLNARAAFTVDGFFLTGDTAALAGGRIYVKERTSDMFVSGGENVYPAEIAGKLLRVPGVADAHVFGASDPTWGRRPVAFIERERVVSKPSESPASLKGRPVRGARLGRNLGSGKAPSNHRAASGQTPVANRDFARSVSDQLSGSLSKIYRPDRLFAVDELPRKGIGKIDRAAIERAYDERLEIVKVVLHRVRIPFKKPFVTAKATLDFRESVIVEVVDAQGCVGLGECVAFSTDWYLPETIEQDLEIMRTVVAPKILSEVYLHPREVSESLAAIPGLDRYPLACGAIEPALWDLYGKATGKPLWRLLAEEYDAIAEAHGAAVPYRFPQGEGAPGESKRQTAQASVAAGAVVGMGSPDDTVAAVAGCVEAGYQRVKLKVAPGSFAAVSAVRKAFPQLTITLDANQSFTDRDLEELRAYDALRVAWIEEPLRVLHGAQGRQHPFARLANLQRTIATPICLDESFVNAREAYEALSHPELRCFAVKVAKFGGIEPALRFVCEARRRNREVWMGGMYDTGISKRMHAAFGALPQVVMPGDIGSTSRYFGIDVTDPPYTAERGAVTLNRAGHEAGLGCDLCREALAAVEAECLTID